MLLTESTGADILSCFVAILVNPVDKLMHRRRTGRTYICGIAIKSETSLFSASRALELELQECMGPKYQLNKNSTR